MTLRDALVPDDTMAQMLGPPTRRVPEPRLSVIGAYVIAVASLFVAGAIYRLLPEVENERPHVGVLVTVSLAAVAIGGFSFRWSRIRVESGRVEPTTTIYIIALALPVLVYGAWALGPPSTLVVLLVVFCIWFGTLMALAGYWHWKLRRAGYWDRS